MKIKKIFFIIFANIFLVLLILIFAESYSAYKYGMDIRNIDSLKQYYCAVFKPVSVDRYFYCLYNKIVPDNVFTANFRPDENINSKKRPVVLFGCSFTWGDELQETETISHKLAQLTGRPVINRAGRGWGLSQLLFSS